MQRVAPGHKVEVSTKAETVKGAFVSASDSTVVVRTKAGQQSIAKPDVRSVSIADPGRRTRNGLIGTAIGLGAGIGIGFAVCPYCANDGNGGEYIGPGAAAGFLPSPFSTIYRIK